MIAQATAMLGGTPSNEQGTCSSSDSPISSAMSTDVYDGRGKPDAAINRSDMRTSETLLDFNWDINQELSKQDPTAIA